MTSLSQIAGFFSPDGPLSQVLKGYEHREQQVEMAEACAQSIQKQRHLAVEAGTGVGKSLAYLLPAYFHAKQANRPVVISTYTINLQQQLVEKDIPLLESALGEDIRWAVAVGRGNYLCLRRLGNLRNKQPRLFEQDYESRQLARIHDWAFQTQDGSLTDLEFAPSHHLWEQLCSSRFTCTGRNCSMSDACFFRKARQKLKQSQIVVSNHYLYFSDLSISDENLRIMPPHSCAIFDEAHTLEEVASECLGLSVSERTISYLVRRLVGDEKHGSRLKSYLSDETLENARGVRRAAGEFFGDVREWIAGDASGNARIREPLPVVDTVSARLKTLAAGLINEARDLDDEDAASEISGCASEILQHAEAIGIIRTLSLDGYVYWIETEREDIALRCAPVRPSGLLSQLLFSRLPTVILTGATLTVGKQDPFGFLRERLGLGEMQEMKLGSPFDYSKQATIHIEKSLPSPENESYVPAVIHAMKRYLKESQGRALVLFTSYSHMKTVSERLTPFLEEHGCRVLVQGSGLPRAKLLETFRSETDSVLFGTSSFWQGVDVPGEALSSVIIARLPFAVPTLPIQEARLEEIETRGEDPFRAYSLPQAVIRLKQGVGRLIRSKTDRGSIIILDSRVTTRRYGRIFVESLPPCRILSHE